MDLHHCYDGGGGSRVTRGPSHGRIAILVDYNDLIIVISGLADYKNHDSCALHIPEIHDSCVIRSPES